MKYAWLPLFYREAAEAAGIEVALRLAEDHGGTAIYFPRTANDEHWLVKKFGRQTADVLCARFGPGNVTLPCSPDRGLKGMQRRAERAIDEGLSANEAARRSGIHVRRIFARRAARRTKPVDLFSLMEDGD